MTTSQNQQPLKKQPGPVENPSLAELRAIRRTLESAKAEIKKVNSATDSKPTKDVWKRLNTGLLAGILLLLLVNWLQEGRRPKELLWEYRVEGVSDITFDSTMQRLGADGWELAFARRAISGDGEYSEGIYEVIFKRPISAAEARQSLKDAD